MKGTRERILDKAEKLFALKGYENVSVREITKLVKCNPALINYYFQSKRNLYTAVFKERVIPRAKRIHKRFFSLVEKNYPSSPEKVIEYLTDAFFKSPLSKKELHIHFFLIAREIFSQSEVWELFRKDAANLLFSKLTSILKTFYPDANEKELVLFVFSIFFQIVHFNIGKENFSKFLNIDDKNELIKVLSSHIIKFSVSGLNSLKGDID